MTRPAAAGTVTRQVPVRWRLSRHSRRLLTLAIAGLLLAVLNRRPELVGLAAPALLLLSAGGLGRGESRPALVAVRISPGATRLFEGEPGWLDLAADDQAGGYDLRWDFHPGKGVEPASAVTVTAAQGAGAARFEFTVPRWGKRQAGTAELMLHDRWRLAEGRAVVTLPSLDVFPRPGTQEAVVTLSRLPNRLGEHSARVQGEGAEFFGLREYVPGDRQRQINWPASTRRGRLMVSTHPAERSQDVVLLVDATSDVGKPGTSALDFGLRGASATARAYLERRDRVGVITYQWGGAQWLAPSLGRRQVYKIIDTMLRADASWSRGSSFARLPRAALPPGALVVAFSPLLDQRFVESLRDLRERGFSLVVVDVLNESPPGPRLPLLGLPVSPRPAGRLARGALTAMGGADEIARRLWQMEQQAIRFSLRELGVRVVHWDGTESLDLPLAPYSRRPLVVRR
ncbi:MAG TPA: DUF58 domain-containing protein [Trebonia sp.]|nr:DUF58 domain-containing protein [Trebonia sp.]